jgi:hypothetical protein
MKEIVDNHSKERKPTSLSGAHSSTLHSGSSVVALTVNKRVELRLLTLWYLLKNLWVGKVQVLAAAITACDAQAILGNV